MRNSIQQTLSELIAPAKLTPALGSSLGLKLNLGMRNAYEFYRTTFEGKSQELLLIIVKTEIPVDLVGRQYQRLQEQSERPILFAFEKLRARARQRLVMRKVPFIIPGKFLFAPMLGFIGETPMFKGDWHGAVTRNELSSWAETILIKLLLDDTLESASGIELANLFHVTPMTISRALRDLEGAEMCNLDKHGTEKKVSFDSRNKLWARAEKILASPVVATVALALAPAKLPIAGEPALEHYTMLVGLPTPTYAIGKREFFSLKKAGKVSLAKLGDETLRLEIWKRDPKALALGDFVDPISLYLSVKNSPDERIQLESRKMMKELGLKVGGYD